jgi:hypothetical protein
MTQPEMPAYHHLDFKQRPEPSIELHTHPDSLGMLAESDEIEPLRQHLGLDQQFVFDGEVWGFGEAANIEPSDIVQGWINLRYRIPKYQDHKNSRSCLSHKSLLPFVASLAYPLNAFDAAIGTNTAENTLPCSKDSMQYLTAHLNAHYIESQYSSKITAKVLPSMIRWLKGNISDELLEGMTSSMYSAYSNMAGRDYSGSPSSFRAALQSARVMQLTVPGDAAGLFSPYDNYKQPDSSSEIYDLSPHNICDSLQQLSLLAGLAYLGGRAVRTSTEV